MKRNSLLFSLVFLGVLFALPARAVTLRYALKKGTEITYKIQFAEASKRSGLLALRASETSSITAETVYRIKVLNVLPSGEMELEREILSGKEKTTEDGETYEVDFLKEKTLFNLSPAGKITLLRTKKPKEAKPSEEPEEEDTKASKHEPESKLPSDMGELQLDLLTDGTFVPLPEKEVQAGDSWECEIGSEALQIPLPPGAKAEPSKVKVKSTLTELADYKGRKCAHIKTTFEMAVSTEVSDPQMPIKASVNAKIAGLVDWYFDYENARTPSATGSMQRLMKITLDIPPEIAAQLPPEAKETAQGSGASKGNSKTTLVEK